MSLMPNVTMNFNSILALTGVNPFKQGGRRQKRIGVALYSGDDVTYCISLQNHLWVRGPTCHTANAPSA